MLYLLDANVLIDANRDYYPIERVPEFWDWLADMGTRERVRLPLEIYEEVREGKDALTMWIRADAVRAALLLDEEADVAAVSRVVADGYAPDLTDDEILGLGRDPFLISYGLRDPSTRCIVTTETSKPSRIRQNRHIPDVCRSFGLSCCNTFEMIRRLDFKTTWR